MSLPDHWIEHCHEDGERVGWIVPAGEDFLADRFVLDLDGAGAGGGSSERPVRISEVGIDGITVVTDEFGGASAVGSGAETIRLPFPAPATLRPAG